MKSFGTQWFRGFALAAAVAIVVACGGGGGGDGGGGTGPAPAPVTPVSISLFAGSLQRAGSSDGVGAAAQFNFPRGVAQDASGNVYVADSGNHTIRKIAPDATVTTLAGAAGQPGSADGGGAAARFSSPRAVVVDGQGNVYVADAGNAVVRKITSGGIVTTLAGSPGQIGGSDGSGANARFQAPVGIAIDSSGNLFVADVGGAVRKVTPAGAVSTFAGAMGEGGFVVADGTAARFTAITGVAVDGAGNVAVSEYSTAQPATVGTVRRFDSQARALPWGDAVDGKVAVGAPVSIAADGTGTVYVVSSGFTQFTPDIVDRFNSIMMITPQGVVSTIAGKDGISNGLVDGPGASASFRSPLGVAVGNAGRVIVADTQNDAIRLIDAQRIVSTLAGGAGTGLVDGPRESARFFGPEGIAAGADGTLYIAESGNRVVRRISPPGTVSTLSFGNSGTVATQFSQALENIAVDDRGVLYIAEAPSLFGRNLYAAEPSGRIRVATHDASFSSFAAMATAPGGRLYFASANNSINVLDADGSNRQFLPGGVVHASAFAVAPDGVLYVADAADHTVRAVDALGHVSLVAGQPGVAGHTDGDKSQATLSQPAALAFDPAGNLYVADETFNEQAGQFGSTIRRITPQGEVRTVAGTPGGTLEQTGPAPSVVGRVRGLAWVADMLYATVENAVLRIGPVN